MSDMAEKTVDWDVDTSESQTNKYTKFEIRVGSHVVSVRIHCTEKWRTSFHTDVLSKSK